MADPIPSNQPTPPNPAMHNAQVAAQVAAQDAAGQSTAGRPEDFQSTSEGLDRLLKEVEAKQAGAAPVEPIVTPETPAETKTPEQVEAEKKAAEEAAEKAAAEESAKASSAKPAEDVFKDVPPLPQGTSTKARESFEAIKTRSVQELSARDEQIAKLNQRVQELESRASTPTTEQLEKDKQISEMRTALAKLDIQFDPKFKDFDQKISATNDFIYAQLKQSPAVSDEVINEIKKFGGPDKCKLTDLFAAIKDPTLQRIVEAKIADVALLKHEKDLALKAVQGNMEGYLKEREQAFMTARTAHTTATQREVDTMLGALDWMKPKVDDPASTEFVSTVKQQLAEALRDDSPQMRAILLTAYAQMCHFQRLAKTQATELDTTKKQLSEVTEKYNKVKQSSTSRLRESGASPSGAAPVPKAANIFTTPAADALDTLAKQVMEQRAQVPK